MPRSKQRYDYDVIVIGSGAGGGVASHIWAREGRKVAIVEDDTIGGECPNYGCVPTKALLKSAEIYDEAKHGARYGVRGTNLTFNYPTIRKWKDLAVARTGTTEGKAAFQAEGITVLKGHAHFISPHELSVSRRRYSAKNFLIATGTKNFVPPIEGLDKAGYITYRDAIDLKSPPKSLFIIGGGAIGLEFAQLFSIFGTKVQVGEMAPHVLPREDPEVGGLVKALFERDRGMRVHAGTRVSKIEKDGSKKIVHFEKEGKTHKTKVDEVMLAAGKVANTDLGLENAGVKYTVRSVETDKHMRTTAKHIFAAGDVAGPYMFTHMASYQSRIAAHNMFSKKGNWVAAKYHAVPRATFISPEVASVGISEREAREKGYRLKIGAVPISVVGRANTSDHKDGFVKVMALKKTGQIVGASIVAPHAGEAIHELALAVTHGLTAAHIESTIHAFPTWSEAVRVACAKIA